MCALAFGAWIAIGLRGVGSCVDSGSDSGPDHWYYCYYGFLQYPWKCRVDGRRYWKRHEGDNLWSTM